MMDHNVIAASHYCDSQEASSEAACYRAAEKHGVLLIADDCDNGEHSCPECPWKDTSTKDKLGVARQALDAVQS